jgi:hypothetical protein
MPYTSVAEVKSARDRYIRVAAIDIVIKEGIMNIYIAVVREELCSTVEIVANKDVPY